MAVKVLPAALTDSTEARARFRCEAQIVAALQHPNICSVYDVGDTSDGQAFLVLELLHGETLQVRLMRGPLDTALGSRLAVAQAREAGEPKFRQLEPNVGLCARD